MENTTQLPTANFWLWPLEESWSLLPIAATLGGALAYTHPETGLLAATLGMLLAGWLPLWRALTITNWTASLQSWHNWEKEIPLAHWPYLQPDTPGAALHQSLSRARSWWKENGAASLTAPLQTIIFALLISLLAGLALGRMALMYTFLLLSWAEMALLWTEGRHSVPDGWEIPAMIGLPWMLGAAVSNAPLDQAAFAALALSIAVTLAARPSRWTLPGYLTLTAFLLYTGQPIAAGLVLGLSFPLLLLQTTPIDPARYRRAALPWLLGTIILTALVL